MRYLACRLTVANSAFTKFLYYSIILLELSFAFLHAKLWFIGQQVSEGTSFKVGELNFWSELTAYSIIWYGLVLLVLLGQIFIPKDRFKPFFRPLVLMAVLRIVLYLGLSSYAPLVLNPLEVFIGFTFTILLMRFREGINN